MIGNFNVNLNKNVITQTLGIVKNAFDAYTNQVNNNNKTFVNTFEIDGEVYYHLTQDIDNQTMESENLISKQIVELEAIKLYKLSKIIESNGGKVLDFNTDCCSCVFAKGFPFKMLDDANIDGFFYDTECTKPKYKLEEKSRLQFERCSKLLKTERYEMVPETWNVLSDVQDNNFQPLVDSIINGNASYFIDGPPGEGK